jgi:predicted O-methyltransferase YrrM
VSSEKLILKDIRKYVFLKSCPNNSLNTEMILFRLTLYLKYIVLAKNRKGHGIHSPFIFDLISRVFRNKTDPAIVSKIEKVRKRLLTDHRTLSCKDLGAGSVKMRTTIREVSYIARYSAIPEKYGRLLSNMAGEFGTPAIIEFGTSLGISTMYLASGCPEAKVFTMEGCAATSEIARMNFKDSDHQNVQVLTSSFEDALPWIVNSGIKPGMVFIDGNHRKEPVVRYFNTIAEISGSETVIIIDDINYSKEMGEAWNEIKSHSKVSVTVDIFRMGIVFFREGINRNNYVVRY